MPNSDTNQTTVVVEGQNKGSGISQSGLFWLWITPIVFAIDQYTKHLAESSLSLGERFAVMPFFNFTLAYNKGAAFSFLADQDGWQVFFFTTISSVVSLLLLYWLYTLKKTNWWLAVALSLILSGALGNLYDRVTLGMVVDFIDWYYESYHFPAFNIADSAIFLGAVMMLWDSFKNPENGNTGGKSSNAKTSV